MNRLLVTVLMLTLSGCGPGVHELKELAISREFNEYQQQAIIDAAEAWFERVPEKFVPVYVGPDRGLGSVVISPNCGGINGMEDNYEGETRIVLCDMLRPGTYQTALHEIGHALAGRPGHIGDGNVLEPGGDSDFMQEITDEDVAFVRGEIEAVE